MHRLLRIGLLVLLAGALLDTRAAAGQERVEVQGLEGAVVADHPLAAAAGAAVLRRGGNAVDAAITMAAVLAVVRPHVNGVGGDALLLLREGRSGRVHALNGSGRTGEAATPAAFRERGLTAVPASGVLSAVVPGAVRAWGDALRRHGTISLSEALAPAIRYAGGGFPVSARLAAEITEARGRIAADPFASAVFLPDGAPPEPGTLLRQPDLAATLHAIARDGAEGLYGGDVGARIAAFMAAERGMITAADLTRHSSTWQQPVTTEYERCRVLAFPPGSQGATLLLQLNIAGTFQLRALGRDHADYLPTLERITRIATAERDRAIADPAFVDVPLDQLVSPRHAARLAALLADSDDDAPRTAAAGLAGGEGDGAFAAAVDDAGNAVLIAQTLFAPFGSGRMVPGTGIVLNNAAAAFTLAAGDINVVAPRKRPVQPLSPVLVLNADGSLRLVLGSAGAAANTHVQMQLLNNVLIFGMSAQRAVEAERSGGGSALLIMQLRDGVRAVGADPRRETFGIAW